MGALVTGFTAYGYLPTAFWTTYALQVGTGIEVVLLSMALGDRLRMDQLKILEAQAARLQQEQLAKQAQERMVERLKKLDRLKDEFIANISHELRTPLNGIIGISESMLDGATGEMSREQKYNLSLVIASGRRLFHLVNDLIDFSQLKHKEIQLHLKPVWVREVVEVVLKLCSPLIGQKPLVLISEQTRQKLSQPEKYIHRYLGRVRVKGKFQSVSIYEVFEAGLIEDFPARFRTLESFEAAVKAYFERDLEQALAGFQTVLEVNPRDTAAQYYRERCERFLAQGLPEDVSPVFV